MSLNMGMLDRILRMLVAVVVGVLYILNMITGWFAVVLLVAAAIFVFTAVSGFCPLYKPLNIDTRKK